MLETWSVTPSEEHRLRVSENRMLRRTVRPKKEEVAVETGEDCIMRTFILVRFIKYY
jgi:hypothetical protein